MTVKIIACEVMKEELRGIEAKQDIEFEFISMGLHLHPKKLNSELQRLLDQSIGYERIILAFGLCGGAVRDLQASDSPLIIPRVHDCIPVLLGSRKRYEQLSKEEKGTFYLSCGWMITEKNILSEHQRIIDKFGEKKAVRILSQMYDSYQRVLFIHTGCQEEADSLRESHKIAELLNLRHETIQGESGYINKLVNGPWCQDEFIHLAPYETVQEEQFGIGAR
ncbi:hypothetical protein SPSIL_010730 [Sporomusa silvacetica DSM 10669]|uniref:DUF1638 domain-containing protein n=1 Tax=Sporomusa silvacetica DSM 10669 TaxID=1123289 RepID=A0ABZ3IHQ7_9FIRM|nr:DUF1638 domain-containing protein [Sporomusa silvacetica]OZC21413.1 hypothetical protein SPSIL_10180 [Sporomusa silvacetica DSM 10669]